jgi:hypothetical protein
MKRVVLSVWKRGESQVFYVIMEKAPVATTFSMRKAKHLSEERNKVVPGYCEKFLVFMKPRTSLPNFLETAADLSREQLAINPYFY